MLYFSGAGQAPQVPSFSPSLPPMPSGPLIYVAPGRLPPVSTYLECTITSPCSLLDALTNGPVNSTVLALPGVYLIPAAHMQASSVLWLGSVHGKAFTILDFQNYGYSWRLPNVVTGLTFTNLGSNQVFGPRNVYFTQSNNLGPTYVANCTFTNLYSRDAASLLSITSLSNYVIDCVFRNFSWTNLVISNGGSLFVQNTLITSGALVPFSSILVGHINAVQLTISNVSNLYITGPTIQLFDCLLENNSIGTSGLAHFLPTNAWL